MSTDKSFASLAAVERNATSSPESSASTEGAAQAAHGTRTLHARATGNPRPVDATAQQRRERLLAHAARSSARREALAALLCSSALADAASVDPGLRREVIRLLAFVQGEPDPTPPAHQAS